MAKVPIHTSPFQLVLGRLITERANVIGIHSGRALGAVLGRSAGVVSQMLKGALIPSGEVVLEIAEVLRLDPAATEELLRSAVQSKIATRGRDGFWLDTASQWERRATRELQEIRNFLTERRLIAEFEAWRAHRVNSSTTAADAPLKNRPDFEDFGNDAFPVPTA